MLAATNVGNLARAPPALKIKFDDSILGQIVNLQNGFGRFGIRVIVFTFLFLTGIIIFALIIEELLAVQINPLSTTDAKDLMVLYFTFSLLYIVSCVCCLKVSSEFFWIEENKPLDDINLEAERIYRKYLLLKTCECIAFLGFVSAIYTNNATGYSVCFAVVVTIALISNAFLLERMYALSFEQYYSSAFTNYVLFFTLSATGVFIALMVILAVIIS